MIKPVSAALMATALLAIPLASCSSEPAADQNDRAADTAATPRPRADAGAERSTPPADNAKTLTLEGYGGLKIGEPVPAGSDWAARGAQVSDACLTITSPGWPGAYAIVEENRVRRITVDDESSARLIEGIGPGSTEAQVRAAFPTFRASPHKYVDAPAKYLTQPGSDARLRFEIDADGKVSFVHIGMMPTLEYVEGCA
ncbi:hypothetical protein [Blastomonas sp.]|uniref:hypothetical protein n=1 Tax=Blastomonas sp. TaxID=1909299 RepID=UPI00406A6C8E